MAKVLCDLEKCKFCKWEDGTGEFVCQADIISLSSEHYCDGGCDEGWEIWEEEGEDYEF